MFLFEPPNPPWVWPLKWVRSVHLQRLAVQVGGVAVALIVGVGLDDAGAFQVFLHERFDPLAGDDVGTVLFAGVQFHAHASFNRLVDLLIGHDKAFGAQVAGEVHDCFVTGALVVG